MFKYKINHYLSLLPRFIPISEVETKLSVNHNIPLSQFTKDRFLEEESPEEIPVGRLLIYAHVLNIPLEYLLIRNKAA
jgi:hypothetical protein